MDLKTSPEGSGRSSSSISEEVLSSPEAGEVFNGGQEPRARSLEESNLDASSLDVEGPSAEGDPMGTPAPDEKVLWKGCPDARLLARTAFHTRSIAIYFVILVGLALAFGSVDNAIILAGLGAVCLGVVYYLAHLSARTSLYILTDVRLILRVGMAIETRVNIPLKQISAANLKMRGETHGDLAMELKGERLLGYLLLWPHARPFRLNHPQPMLRAVPDAERVAQLLADACAQYGAIEKTASAGGTASSDGAAAAGMVGAAA